MVVRSGGRWGSEFREWGLKVRGRGCRRLLLVRPPGPSSLKLQSPVPIATKSLRNLPESVPLVMLRWALIGSMLGCLYSA